LLIILKVPGNLSTHHKRQLSEGRKVKIATFSEALDSKIVSPRMKMSKEYMDLNPYVIKSLNHF